jgi:DNA repair protein RecO (recombination protein O)
MVALLDGDWNHAGASDGGTRREASGLVAAHLQWHLERGLRSLPLVDRNTDRSSDRNADRNTEKGRTPDDQAAAAGQ